MSAAGEHYEVVVEGEFLPQRKLVLILLGGIAVIIATAIIVKSSLPPRLVVETGGYTGNTARVGSIEQTLLLGVHSEQDHLRTERESLRRYSWIDRKRGIVAIPIDRAMELVARGRK